MPEPQPRGLDRATGQFLRLCLRGGWDPAAWETVEVLAGQGAVDWEELARIALESRLAPLLYRNVRDRGLVPTRLEAEWRRVYLRLAQRNILLFRELGELLRHLAEAGVAAILLKGAALSEGVYRNPAVRPMDDLDLLVSRGDSPTALRVLAGLGYQTAGVEVHSGADVAFENEVMLHKAGRLEILLELHWNLFDSPHYQQILPLPWFWQTALPLQVGGTQSLILGPEAQILHLSGHQALHHGGEEALELLWLQDVAEVIAAYRGRIDWGELLAKAQACDLVLSLQRVLSAAVEQLGASIPADVLGQLQALRPSAAERRVYALLTAQRRPVAQRFWADLASVSGWRDRLRFASMHLFPSPAYMRHRYRIRHPLVVPLYYLYRWWLGLRNAL